MTDTKTFECAWCKAAGPDSAEDYTYPIEQLGAQDNATGEPICENCADYAAGRVGL